MIIHIPLCFFQQCKSILIGLSHNQKINISYPLYFLSTGRPVFSNSGLSQGLTNQILLQIEPVPV